MLSHALHAAILDAGDAVCAEIAGTCYSYRQLAERAAALVAAWDRLDPRRHPVAILCDHSFLGYAAVVAALVSGRAYVPLKPGLPAERIRIILEAAGCRVMSGDDALTAPLTDTLGATGTVVAPEDGDEGAPPLAPGTDASGTAYIMFTSGSTGKPKGVVLSQANVAAYCEAARTLFRLEPTDRCTQLFDLSFDLSVHDILVTFLSGACLVTDVARQRIDPVGFAADVGATVWFSVPSVLSMAKRFRRLKPGVLPSVRLALFCGEALPVAIAREWVAAAPNARHINVYGPTEATIAITWHEFTADSLATLTEASVPIGEPYPGSVCAVVDGEGHAVAAGELGELWLGGPQLADGYLGNPSQTAERFVTARLPGADRWYRTGDLAVGGTADGLLFKGRVDHQVKIQGYRVELDEIESIIRAANLAGEVSVFPYRTRAGVTALACAVTSVRAEVGDIVRHCRRELPDYCVPDRVLVIDTIPLNQNDKVDRNRLAAMAEASK